MNSSKKKNKNENNIIYLILYGLISGVILSIFASFLFNNTFFRDLLSKSII